MFRVMLPAFAITLISLTFAPAADSTIQLFDGKDLKGWKAKDQNKSKWQVCTVSINPQKPTELLGGINNTPDGKHSVLASITPGCDIFTEQKLGDGTYEVEFMIPKGSNSGIYLMGEYEVQILDSYGKEKVGPGDLGGLYQAAAPKLNASRKPGEWQKFVIEFLAPKFDGEKKTANARFVKVTLNDKVIHENVELKGPTPGGLTGKEAPTGPLMFQGDHGPVAFRNISYTPRK